MFKFIFIIATILNVIVFVKAQSADTTWCDIKVTNSPKIPVINNNQQYEALIERNDLIKLSSEEIKEYYDGKNNVGIAETTFNGQTIKTFSYYDRNELLYVFDNQCQASRLDLTYSLTPFFLATINGKETLVSPLNVILNAHDLEVGFIGSSQIRGINVANWETCFYSKSENATIKATLSYTDNSKWVPSSGDTEDSVPVQVKLEKRKPNGFVDIDTYSLFRFKEILGSQNDQEFAQLPNGVYCKNKASLKEIPELPNSFEFSMTVVSAEDDESKSGFVTFANIEYDYSLKLFKYLRVDENQEIAELHDYNTGIQYSHNKNTGSCKASVIDNKSIDSAGTEIGSLLTMKNPKEFFEIEGGNFQYTGQRFVDGVNTNVWTGTKKLPNLIKNTTFELSLLAENWNRADLATKTAVPVLLVTTNLLESPVELKPSAILQHYHHFQPLAETVRYDGFIEKCDPNVAKRNYRFRITKTAYDSVLSYFPEFKLGILKSLQNIAKVAFIRIGNLKIIYDQRFVNIFFTVFQKSTFYGNVDLELDLSLDVANSNLVNAFSFKTTKDQVQITFDLPGNQEYKIPVIMNSFKEVDEDGVPLFDSFCDINDIYEDPDHLRNPFPVVADDAVYQLDIERNKDEVSEEVIEYYDGKRNMARSTSFEAGLKINSYVYPQTKELLLVTENVCKRYDLTYNKTMVDEATSFSLVTKNDKLKVVGGILGLLNNENLKQIKYTGTSQNIRGIPVKQWKACLYEEETNTTSRITVSYTNEQLWTPASSSERVSVPVQVQIETETKSEKKYTNEINSIVKYQTGSVINEETFYTDSGVYCPDRISTKPFPVTPARYSMWSQQSYSTDSSDLSGTVSISRYELDSIRRLFINKVYEKDQDIKEVLDFNSNLLYKINQNLGTCKISKADPNDEKLLFNDLFKADEKPNYHYVGLGHVRGIETNIWNAPRQYKNQSTIWEWHFSSENWIMQEQTDIKQNDPVSLTIIFPDGKHEYYNIVNYDKSKNDLFDYDISLCQDQIANKHIRFEIKPKACCFDNMKADQENVNTLILDDVMLETGISLLRIGSFETIYDNGTIFVTFTLFDRPAFYGNDKFKEDSLDVVVHNLKKSIIEDRSLSIQYGGFVYPAEKNSFVILEKRQGRYVYETVKTGKTIDYTLGAVFGFLVAFIIVGLAVGFAIGHFFIIKRETPLPELPGPLSVLNPVFTQSA